MNFDTMNVPIDIIRESVKVGDVFSAKGGRGRTILWIVVAVHESTAHCLGVNADGQVISTSTYGVHHLAGRQRVGVIPELENLTFGIESI